MKVEILGCASAFAKDSINSSVLLWLREDNAVLLDCGYNVFPKIMEKGYADKINTILLSHAHQDHCGSAVTLLEYRHNILKQKTFVGGINWKKLLKLCDGDNAHEMIIPLHDAVKVETIDVPHAKGMECKALFVEDTLLYSGDSAISLLDTPEAKQAKIIIHDVHLTGNAGHVSLAELGNAMLDIRAKTYLTHYLPKDYKTLSEKAKSLSFADVATEGMIIDIDDFNEAQFSNG